jgi:hypothetical protein
MRRASVPPKSTMLTLVTRSHCIAAVGFALDRLEDLRLRPADLLPGFGEISIDRVREGRGALPDAWR